MDQPDPPKHRRIRRDGWTIERQLDFLETLIRTRNVTRAARAVGMSRESAYRLRNRHESSLFAALWDRAMLPDAARISEGHSGGWTDGRLARLLGIHFRRQRGDFRRSA